MRRLRLTVKGNSMSPTDLLFALGGAFGSGVWFWYDKKKTDQQYASDKKKAEEDVKELRTEVRALNDVVVEHKSIHITETKSRQIAEEVCGRMEKDVAETKNIVTSMMTQVSNLAASLQTHTAVQRALQEREKQQPPKE